MSYIGDFGSIYYTKGYTMSKDVNKRIGKFCRVCDNELYETDTKSYSRKLGDLSVFVGYAHNWNNDNVCHGCITEAVVRGEILEK